MRRVCRFFIQVTISVLLIAASGCGNAPAPSAAAFTAARIMEPSAPAVPETPEAMEDGPLASGDLAYMEECGSFIFHCMPDDGPSRDFADAPHDSLVNDSRRIAGDLQIASGDTINVYLWPTVDSFHMAMGLPDAPAWMRGTIGRREIYTVSPSAQLGLPLDNVLLHEYTHILESIMSDAPLPRWLNEGVASYEGREVTAEMIKRRVAGKLPTLGELNDRARDFNAMGGYEFSYTVIRFVVETYGYDSLIRLIREPGDFNGIFNMDAAQFEKGWTQFVEKVYG